MAAAITDMHVRVPTDRLARLKIATKDMAEDAALARAGLAALEAMIVQGRLNDLKLLIAENTKARGPRRRAAA
jgi:hypothetical protein